MKTKQLYTAFLSLVFLITGACSQEESKEILSASIENISESVTEEVSVVHLSELQFNTLGIETGTLQQRVLSETVRVNGQLEVPPQHKATVTSIFGANVVSIEIEEGDFVTENQVLAYLAHPNLILVQTEYIRSFRQMNFLEKKYQRQKRLYNEEIESGQQFQQVEAEYETIKGEVKGYEARLKQLNLDSQQIQNGMLYERIPIVSPVKGYIEEVAIQLGQYVDPQTTLFQIINNDQIHADFMVYEKDVIKVKKGQKVTFTVESMPNEELTASIFSVGKMFEQAPKAVHIHAEIDDPKEYMIPGMYINGSIQTSSEKVWALPEEAIVNDEGKSWIFLVEKNIEAGEVEWEFTPFEIVTGNQQGKWVEIKFLDPPPGEVQVAMNNAYYLISEMKKSGTSHGH